MYIVYIYIYTVKFHNILYFEIVLLFSFFYVCKNWSEEINSHTRHIFCWEAMTAIKQLTVDLFKMSAQFYGLQFYRDGICSSCIQTHSHSLSVEGEERSEEFLKRIIMLSFLHHTIRQTKQRMKALNSDYVLWCLLTVYIYSNHSYVLLICSCVIKKRLRQGRDEQR